MVSVTCLGSHSQAEGEWFTKPLPSFASASLFLVRSAMEHRVLEIGAQELAHRHDVVVETDHEVSEGVSGAGSTTLWRAYTLTSNDTDMQIVHLGEVDLA